MYTYNKFGSRAPPTESPQVHTVAKLDYNNNFIHTGINPVTYIRNVISPNEGYPKLQKLHQLKKSQVEKHSVQPYGVRCPTDQIVPTINRWTQMNIKFDVIMIGALVENQLILSIFKSLPLHKLCSKPGFLFIWATTQKIKDLTDLLNNEHNKFRRSEELIFIPTNKPLPQDQDGLFEKQQWHCWMCITGTVRRSTDSHLIHCNIDTDLQIDSITNAVPDAIYKVAENFSNSTRRLHIIPSSCHVKLRPGWVIISPDILLSNFDPIKYSNDVYSKSMVKRHDNKEYFLIDVGNEIEQLRPKTPKN